MSVEKFSFFFFVNEDTFYFWYIFVLNKICDMYKVNSHKKNAALFEK